MPTVTRKCCTAMKFLVERMTWHFGVWFFTCQDSARFLSHHADSDQREYVNSVRWQSFWWQKHSSCRFTNSWRGLFQLRKPFCASSSVWTQCIARFSQCEQALNEHSAIVDTSVKTAKGWGFSLCRHQGSRQLLEATNTTKSARKNVNKTSSAFMYKCVVGTGQPFPSLNCYPSNFPSTICPSCGF